MSIDDIQRAFESAEIELPRNENFWDDPEAIQDTLPPVDEFPLNAISKPLHDFIVDTAYRMQCPPDFIAVTILVVLSSLIGAGCGVKPKKNDDWLVIPNLWGCIVAPPGKLKTPAVNSVMSSLDKLEKEEKIKFDDEVGKKQKELDIFKAKKKGLLDKITRNSVKGGVLTEQQKLANKNLENDYHDLKEPKTPVRKRFKTNDITVEKLGILLTENPKGLLVYRDELIGLLKTWEKNGHEGDRAYFMEAWNGTSSYSTDRVSRETNDAENICVSIFGTTQPDKLISYLINALNGNNDGLIQRFQLLVYPDHTDWELVDSKPNQDAKKNFFNLAKELADLDFIKYGAKKNDEGKLFFQFDESAQKVFYEWITDLEKEKLNNDDHPLLLEHLTKYRKLMPALALIFHLVDLISNNNVNNVNGISAENTENACALCDYFESHARRIYGLVTDIRSIGTAILAKKIQKKKLKDGFTQRDIQRLRGVFNDKKVTQSACDELIGLGWLREKETPPRFQQKGKISYLINPKIFRGKHE